MSGNKAVKAEILDSKEVFKGKIIDVFHDTISLPDGRSALREVVKRGGASAVIPVDNDGNIIFVRQYRHPIMECALEIPAGIFEGDEDPFVCAERELEEETSLKAKDIKFLTKMHSAIGFCDEQIYIYLAQELEQGKLNLDDDEFIQVERYSLNEAMKMIFDGRITDSKTMVAVLAYKTLKEKEQ